MGALLAWHVRRDNPKQNPEATAHPQAPLPMPDDVYVATSQKPHFDFYLLALTIHSAFCADGHAGEAECRMSVSRPLVIHGLWPENLKPRTYPHDCTAPRLQLDPGFVRALEDYMPGVRDGLHVHEWREHGSCSGLDDFVYFTRTLEFAHDLDAALAAYLTTLAGKETDAAGIRAAADAVSPGLGATFTLHCRTLRNAPPELRHRPFLVEVRQCIDNDGENGEPGTVFDCARVDRRDQGCGGSFRIAKMGR